MSLSFRQWIAVAAAVPGLIEDLREAWPILVRAAGRLKGIVPIVLETPAPRTVIPAKTLIERPMPFTAEEAELFERMSRVE